MKKLWRLGLSLGATLSVVAPLATIACGTKIKGVRPAEDNSDQGDKTKGLVEASKEIKNVSSNSTTIKDIDVTKLTPYSVTTLRAEALSLYNNNAGAIWAGWRGNPLMGAVYSTVSLVKALANEYGYDKEINGVNRKNDFFKKQNMTSIIDENSIDANQTEEIKKQAKFLASLKQESLQKIVHLPFSIGETDQVKHMNDVFKLANINFTTYPDTYGNDEGQLKDNLKLDNFAIWDNVKKPGQAIMSVYTTDHLYREIDLQNVKDKFAIIEKTKFENDYIPYIKSALLGFVKLINENIDMLTFLPNGGLDPVLNDQIAYLLEKNTDENGEFKFDDKILANALNSFNNGSINWLAIKAVLCGFDNSITKNEYSLLTNNKAEVLGKIDYGIELPGVHLWTIDDLIRWLSWLDSGVGSKYNALNDDQSLFNATDIIDETYLKGKTDDQKIDALKEYIKSHASSVNP